VSVANKDGGGTAILLLIIAGIAAFFWLRTPSATNPQATYLGCSVLWHTVKDNMRIAKNSEGIDKLYYLKIADINVNVMMHRGCCKYDDTCPASVGE
jgi:hypothetical protein